MRHAFLFILPVLFALTPASYGASPRETLLSYVPNDSALCLVIDNLRNQSNRMTQSPFSEWLAGRIQPILGASDDYKKLIDAEKFFSLILGLSVAELRDDILGDCVVLCYLPAEENDAKTPMPERGLVMLHAREPKKLAKLLDRLDAAQKDSGELKELKTRTHRNTTYTVRVRTDGKEEFYLQSDALFLFSTHESAIHTALDTTHADPKTRFFSRCAELVNTEKSFLSCFVQPRRFDREFQKEILAAASAEERAFREQFFKVWQCLDTIAIDLQTAEGLSLRLSLAYRENDLPPAIRPLLVSHSEPSKLWNAIPNDAMFALVGRINPSIWLDAIVSFSPPEAQTTVRRDLESFLGAVVGKSKYAAVIKAIGPHAAFWVNPSTLADQWFPHVSAAIEIDPSTDTPTQKAISQATEFLARLGVVQYNREHDDQLELQEVDSKQGSRFVLSRSTGFPDGVTPTFMMRGDYAIVTESSTRPDEILEALRSPTTPQKPTLIARINAKSLRRFFVDHERPLSNWLSRREDKPREELQAGLTQLASILEAFRSVELHADQRLGFVSLSLNVEFVAPLQKPSNLRK